MPSAPLPTPQYINYTDNVQPYIGTDKILVADNNSTAIPVSLANQLIATGESLALQDLAPYYVTVPALITIDNLPWTSLPASTYDTIYYMFVIQASMKLIGNFIARNTDTVGTSLSEFQKFYASEYNKYLNRIVDKLPNGSYKYQMIGLKALDTGIPRKPQRYAASGTLGACGYVDRQLTDPAKNYASGWPWGPWGGTN